MGSMQPDDLLTLARLLKDKLSRAKMKGHFSTNELNEAVEHCETLVQELESLSSKVKSKTKAATPRRTPKVHSIRLTRSILDHLTGSLRLPGVNTG